MAPVKENCESEVRASGPSAALQRAGSPSHTRMSAHLSGWDGLSHLGSFVIVTEKAWLGRG